MEDILEDGVRRTGSWTEEVGARAGDVPGLSVPRARVGPSAAAAPPRRARRAGGTPYSATERRPPACGARGASQEDALLCALVAELGTKSWSVVADRMGGARSGKSCRLRCGARRGAGGRPSWPAAPRSRAQANDGAGRAAAGFTPRGQGRGGGPGAPPPAPAAASAAP
jgi:hypothetical protein